MFSRRLPAHLAQSSLARLIEDKRPQLLDLTSSNPTRNGFVYPEGVLDTLRDPRALSYDPEPLGMPIAREAVAQMYDVAPAHVVLSASSSEAYSWLFKLMCDPGDEILIPRPSYPLFEFLAGLDSVVTRTYPLHYHEGWFIDFDALEAAITPRTRFVVIVNPNNPTGSYLKSAEQSQLEDICERHDLAIISDEVFREYPLGGKPLSLIGNRRTLIFVLGGLSKLVGLPQMKLGWAIVCGPGDMVRKALERLEIIADSYLSVGTPAQYALPALLESSASVRAQISARNKANLDWVRFGIRGSAASLLEVEAGWSAILRVPQTRSEEEWVTQLVNEVGVLVQPGYFYDMEGGAYLVVSLVTPPAVFQEGITRILESAASEVGSRP